MYIYILQCYFHALHAFANLLTPVKYLSIIIFHCVFEISTYILLSVSSQVMQLKHVKLI